MIDLEKLRDKQIPERLRLACSEVRTKSYPLSDLIPLMQQAADHIATLEKDAGRYKWLREKGKHQQETYMYCCGDELDSEIDEDLVARQAIDTAMESKHG